MREIQEDIKDLQNEEPRTKDELKAWLPEQIGSMNRTGFNAGQTAYMQIAQIEGTYQNEEKLKKLKVQVIDGAGEMGANATLGFGLRISQDFEEENENKINRSVMKNEKK